jgi:hypothetical protein
LPSVRYGPGAASPTQSANGKPRGCRTSLAPACSCPIIPPRAPIGDERLAAIFLSGGTHGGAHPRGQP